MRACVYGLVGLPADCGDYLSGPDKLGIEVSIGAWSMAAPQGPDGDPAVDDVGAPPSAPSGKSFGTGAFKGGCVSWSVGARGALFERSVIRQAGVELPVDDSQMPDVRFFWLLAFDFWFISHTMTPDAFSTRHVDDGTTRRRRVRTCVCARARCRRRSSPQRRAPGALHRFVRRRAGARGARRATHYFPPPSNEPCSPKRNQTKPNQTKRTSQVYVYLTDTNGIRRVAYAKIPMADVYVKTGLDLADEELAHPRWIPLLADVAVGAFGERGLQRGCVIGHLLLQLQVGWYLLCLVVSGVWCVRRNSTVTRAW